VPGISFSDPATFERKVCNLIIVKNGLCRIFSCDEKLFEDTEQFAPFVAFYRYDWNKM
jgi:hypothetical protein